ncbi:MAG: DNA-binding domain-containing protein [Methylobacter sp.]
MKQPLQQLQEQLLSSITGLNKPFTNCRLLPTAYLSPEHSLAIYQHGYKARLLDCLRADYPVLKSFLGEALFERFALEYLDANPSGSYSLFQLGERFPDYLQHSCPDTSQLSEAQQAGYRLPIELARLERLRVNAMRAKGLEGYPQQEPDYYCMETLKQLRPKAPATLGLMSSVHNLPDYYQALRSGNNGLEEMPPAELSPSYLAVSRSNYRLSIHSLASWQYGFLKGLSGHEQNTGNDPSIAERVEQIAGTGDMEPEHIYAYLPLWLPVAIARGYLYFQEAVR